MKDPFIQMIYIYMLYGHFLVTVHILYVTYVFYIYISICLLIYKAGSLHEISRFIHQIQRFPIGFNPDEPRRCVRTLRWSSRRCRNKVWLSNSLRRSAKKRGSQPMHHGRVGWSITKVFCRHMYVYIYI